MDFRIFNNAQLYLKNTLPSQYRYLVYLPDINASVSVLRTSKDVVVWEFIFHEHLLPDDPVEMRMEKHRKNLRQKIVQHLLNNIVVLLYSIMGNNSSLCNTNIL